MAGNGPLDDATTVDVRIGIMRDPWNFVEHMKSVLHPFSKENLIPAGITENIEQIVNNSAQDTLEDEAGQDTAIEEFSQTISTTGGGKKTTTTTPESQRSWATRSCV